MNKKHPAAKSRSVPTCTPQFRAQIMHPCDGWFAVDMPAFKREMEKRGANNPEIVGFIEDVRHNAGACAYFIDKWGDSFAIKAHKINDDFGKTIFNAGCSFFKMIMSLPKATTDGRFVSLIALEELKPGAEHFQFDDDDEKFKKGIDITSQTLISIIVDSVEHFKTYLAECQIKFPSCADVFEKTIIDVEDFPGTMIGLIDTKHARNIFNAIINDLRDIRIALAEHKFAPAAIGNQQSAIERMIADSEERTQMVIHANFKDLESVKAGVEFLVGKKRTRSIKGKAAQAKVVDMYAAEKARAAKDMATAVARVADDADVQTGKHGAVRAACHRICKEFKPMTSKKNALGKFEEYKPLTDYMGNAIKSETLERNFRKWRKTKPRKR